MQDLTPSPKERGQNSLWKRVSKDLKYFIRTIMIFFICDNKYENCIAILKRNRL
jgi:hypothetical protein